MIYANGCATGRRGRAAGDLPRQVDTSRRPSARWFSMLAASGLAAAGPAFVQTLDPLHSTAGTTLVALVPIALLLLLLAVARMTAWQAVIIGAVVTVIMAITIWHAPASGALGAWG